MKLTQYQKILTIMARQPERWFYPYDFMDNGLGIYFVGYKASSRISELAKEYPEIFETKEAGKYIVRRLRMESASEWLSGLPKDLRYAIHRSGLTHNIKGAE